ncbi:MAG: hypothetical protein IIX01_01820, partial [Clostridia bacterium]|nr:hypothetical protein [Clostridia bacterium]
MSYDVIEGMLPGKKLELEMASLIQREGEVQFTRYLPLEMPTKVEPQFEQLRSMTKSFVRCAERIQTDFVLCGYYLNQIKKRGLYLYCVETGLQGYTNFFKFCEDKLGVPTTTAQRLILINDRFCGGTHTLPDKFYKYGSSKLALMATFQNGLEGKIAPVTSVKDIEKLHKFYASHGWNVDLETTWKDDLETYRREEV